MKLKKLSIICAALAFLILTSNAFAQEQQSFVRKVLGGGGVGQLIQTKDGSYAYLNGHGITKVDPSGNLISEASLTFDLPYDRPQIALEGIAQTSNGFVLVGWVRDGYEGIAKGIVVKVNMEGQVVWNKLFSGKVADGTYALYFFSLIPTADGGFIVTGERGGSLLVIRFSPSGTILWSKWLNIYGFFQSAPTLDGGVILATGQPSKSANVIKMSRSGELAWAVTLEMGRHVRVHSLTALSDRSMQMLAV